MNPFKQCRVRRLAAALLPLVLAIAVAACGDSGGEVSGESASQSEPAGNGTDVAFIDGMVPHHESAIDMAKMARENAKTSFVKTLADDIVKSQGEEISQMERIKASLSGVEKTDLGISMRDMGMDMDDSMLEDAKPFDRMFVDMMIPHHQGAIRMARVELAKGQNAELRAIAGAVIAAQSREINAMNAFRKRTYGDESPAGGIPAEKSATGTDDSSEMDDSSEPHHGG
jgi:uncharacterized protein (DUF305 family)